MHALNALPAVVLELAVGVADLDAQADRANAATETTATIFIDERKALSLCEMHRTCEMHKMMQLFVTLLLATTLPQEGTRAYQDRYLAPSAIAATDNNRAPSTSALSSTTMSPWCRS